MSKKIAVFDAFLGYNVGGAQKSLQSVLDVATQPLDFIGCEVGNRYNAKALKMPYDVQRFPVKRIPFFPYWQFQANRNILKKQFESLDADILLAQGIMGATAARYFPGKVVFFVRCEYQLNNISIVHTDYKKYLKHAYLWLQKGAIDQLYEDNIATMEKASLIMANSQYNQNGVKRVFGKEASRMYPVVPIKSYLEKRDQAAGKERKYILSIGSEAVKGKSVIEGIAKQFPDEQFVIFGRAFKKKIQKGNILYHPWGANIHDWFLQAKLVLIASQWQEAFPRVLVEAQSFGAPVVSSNNGGLPEGTPKSQLVDDYANPAAWVPVVRASLEQGAAILSDEELLGFDKDTQVQSFISSFEQTFGFKW